MADPNSGCWLWTGSTTDAGYGQTSDGTGKVVKAHRLSYEERIGKIPRGMMVCHKCDTPSCINPDHLFLGTAKDNQTDSIRKGRNARGERQGVAKLSDQQAREIKSRIAAGQTNAEISAAYPVGPAAIWQIRQGNAWRHV